MIKLQNITTWFRDWGIQIWNSERVFYLRATEFKKKTVMGAGMRGNARKKY